MKIYDRNDYSNTGNSDNKKPNNNNSFSAFRNIAIATVIAAGVAIGGYTVYDNNIDSKVQAAETLVTQTGFTTLEQLNQFQTKNAELYQKNKELLSSLEKDQSLLKAMKVNINIPQLIKNNDAKFQVAIDRLNQDIRSTENLTTLNNRLPTEQEKREIFYHNPTDFENFKNASSNNSVNNQELANINATLQKHATFLKEAKLQILKTVKEKIASKEFNIDKKKKEYQTQVAESIYEEKKGIAEIKSELEKDSDLKAAIDPKEIANSEKAIEEMEDLAMDQILKDEKLITEMVSTLSEKGLDVEKALETTPTQTTAATNSGGGFNFLHYYLLSQWLSSSNSSAAAMGAAPAYNGAMKSSMVSSNPYDIKDKDSHVNQTIIGSNLRTSSGMSYAQMHENMTKTKNHVTSYKSSRTVSRSVSIRGSSGG